MKPKIMLRFTASALKLLEALVKKGDPKIISKFNYAELSNFQITEKEGLICKYVDRYST